MPGQYAWTSSNPTEDRVHNPNAGRDVNRRERTGPDYGHPVTEQNLVELSSYQHRLFLV